jgi:general secretion pathway protein H
MKTTRRLSDTITKRAWRRSIRAGLPDRGVGSRGFTLLELIVVIAILGVVVGLVTLSTAPAEHRRLAEELERLAALFRLAQDEALISGQAITWQADANGYRFYTPDGVRGEKNSDDPLRPRNWTFEVDSIESPMLVFGGEPLMTPARLHLMTAGREVTLELDAFGEMKVLQ